MTESREEQTDQAASIVARVVAGTDAEVADAAHQLQGTDIGVDLAGFRCRLKQLSADGHQAVEEIGVQRVEAGAVGLLRSGESMLRDQQIHQEVDLLRQRDVGYAATRWQDRTGLGAGLDLRAAKRALAEIYDAEDKVDAHAAAKMFAAEFEAKWPKAAAKITDDLDVLLGFYDYPAEHWVHLRTTNPIESTFATLRQRVTKGPGSRAAGLAMAFKLIESAQARWRCVNASHLVARVRAGAIFTNGRLVERPDDQDQRGGDQQAA